MSITINVAEDYSPFVLGRYPTDSEYNGEDFRESILLPALRRLLKNRSEYLLVNLNGTFGPDPSFLEEAFGGAVRRLREEQTNPTELWKRVQIEYDEQAQRKEILDYIQDALNT